MRCLLRVHRVGPLCTTPRQLKRLSCRRQVAVRASGVELRPLVILECDGVVADLHTDGHRVAFNATFSSQLKEPSQELGLDCASWTPDVYHDLIRYGDGTEENLIHLFFSKVGWPATVATSDYDSLAKQVVVKKKQKLQELLQQREIPLRQGVLQFVDEVLAGNARIAVLTETQSDQQDAVWPSLKPLFGTERGNQIQSIAWPETVSKFEDMGEAVNEQIRQKKREEAEAFVTSMNARRREKQVSPMEQPLVLILPLEVDPSFFLSLSAALGSTVRESALVAGHNFLLQSASASGLLCVAVPAGRACRQVFPGAHVRFDGFGAGGGLSWPRLLSLIKQRSVHE